MSAGERTRDGASAAMDGAASAWAAKPCAPKVARQPGLEVKLMGSGSRGQGGTFLGKQRSRSK